ncbi:ankyrin repeat domain-containing protein [Lusitaniella coriacea LEGE 07157]|uniref:Ankyrin repeat domain-containing protein n=1 Tax=Lusitaniella coriacea LEGE 07157 TaxID=945747 RepID=A0A8J7DWL6_9CYAN|nr:ankyrin repeat domain-containing protein [Lusitaniella coriacea]MBE9116180.1 ankyrin repeat domain-containing protein [Lusitaniella coriacea LEGE 07157]
MELLNAIHDNNLEEVEKLCKKGVDEFRFFCDFGDSILEYAVQEGNLEIVKVLIASGVDINSGLSSSPANIAIQAGRKDILLALLEAGLDVNQKLLNAWTPLMSAANSGKLSIIKLLVERGANVNATTEEGYSAVWFAVEGAWLHIFDYLNPLTAPELQEKWFTLNSDK